MYKEISLQTSKDLLVRLENLAKSGAIPCWIILHLIVGHLCGSIEPSGDQLKHAVIFLVCVSMLGCSKEEPIRYVTYEQAMSEAAEGAKWLPAFLPVTSSNIVGAFDVDADQLAVEFEFPAGTFNVRASGLREIGSSVREQIVGEQKFPWWSKMQKKRSLEVLEFCEGGKLGALFVDQQGGRAYYTLPPSHGSRECN